MLATLTYFQLQSIAQLNKRASSVYNHRPFWMRLPFPVVHERTQTPFICGSAFFEVPSASSLQKQEKREDRKMEVRLRQICLL